MLLSGFMGSQRVRHDCMSELIFSSRSVEILGCFYISENYISFEMIYAYLPLTTLVIIWDIYKKLSTSFTCIPHVQELTVVSRGYKCSVIITNEVWGKLQENERFEIVWSAATWLNRKNVCWEVFPEEKNDDGLLRFISKRHIP